MEMKFKPSEWNMKTLKQKINKKCYDVGRSVNVFVCIIIYTGVAIFLIHVKRTFHCNFFASIVLVKWSHSTPKNLITIGLQVS